MSTSLNQAMLDRVPRVLGQYYTGDVLAQNVKVLQQHILADRPGKVRYLAGGVDNVTFQSIVITGLTADTEVTMTAWTIVAQDQGEGKLAKASPRNDVKYDFTLTKVDGRWLINSEKWEFMPGSEP